MKSSIGLQVSIFQRLLIMSLFVISLVGWFSWHFGSVAEFHPFGLATASRTLNVLLGVVLTTIALIVPLTSNLYSPKLVKLFVSQPIIIGGLITLILAILFNLSSHFFNSSHPWYPTISTISITFAYFSLASIIPYLFMISRFLRPSYFIPTLSARAMKRIVKIQTKGGNRQDWVEVIKTVDVLANIALTSMKRNDQQLIILILRFLQEILCNITLISGKSRYLEPGESALFFSGLTREAKQHLEDSGLWPEAYVLFHFVRITEICDHQQNVVFSESGKLMVATLIQAEKNNCEGVMELIILSMNTLMRTAIDTKDTSKFQNLSYYYVLAADGIFTSQTWMNELVRHLKHYGRLAEKNGVVRARETVVYDLCALASYLFEAKADNASDFLHHQLIPYLRFSSDASSYLSKATLQAIVKLYWQIKSIDDDNDQLELSRKNNSGEMLRKLFLEDDNKHAEILHVMLQDNKPLHWELNDRLLRFSYIPMKPKNLAEKFLEAYKAEQSSLENLSE